MTREDIAAQLSAIESVIDTRVTIVRVILDPDGTIVREHVRGSFQAPPDWQPPTLEHLIAIAKGRNS